MRQGCSPNSRHGGAKWNRRSHPPGQFPLGPVRGPLGHLFQGAHDHLLHLGVADAPRDARAGLIAQPVQAAGQQPGPPLGDRGPADAQPRSDGDIRAAVRAGQHDPRPQRQPLGGLAPLRPVLQRPPLGFGQHERLQPVITHATSRPRADAAVVTWLWPETKSDSRGEKGTQDRDTREAAPRTAEFCGFRLTELTAGSSSDQRRVLRVVSMERSVLDDPRPAVVTAADIVAGHVTLDISCLDRIYLNGYIAKLQTSGGVVYFFNDHRGKRIVSPALFEPIGAKIPQGHGRLGAGQRRPGDPVQGGGTQGRCGGPVPGCRRRGGALAGGGDRVRPGVPAGVDGTQARHRPGPQPAVLLHQGAAAGIGVLHLHLGHQEGPYADRLDMPRVVEPCW